MFAIRVLLTMAVLAQAGLAVRVDEGEKGPNGGILFEGAKHKYHIELKIDAEGKTATAYILDSKAKKAVPIKAKTIEVKIKGEKSPITLTGVASKDQTFTQYKGKSDRFGKKLDFNEVE